ncbi:hypothetical protein TL16_g06906 [Triparma laevis f. inornata]|uniref:non-specific serine/threonine protein kinase n=1 Tax=Triparma laevis f. inornata TaxID=1714386 RepID=A0A9W7EC36_9STRA|nr:hypothetical protein TL16_g06906 [Triparma laevis f. inornata]
MSTTTTTPQPVHKPPKTLPQLLDSSGTSLLPPPLFQGAESLIYSLPFSALYPSLPTSPLLILKHRFPKKYRHPTIDNRITKHRTKSEVKCIARCRRAGVLCPIIYGVGPDYIVMENVGTRTLRSYLQTLPPSSTLSPPAITALKLLTQSIIKIHSASVVHGDLTTGNFMFTAESKIVAIDFGLSSICAPNQGSKKRKQNDQSGASNNRIEGEHLRGVSATSYEYANYGLNESPRGLHEERSSSC